MPSPALRRLLLPVLGALLLVAAGLALSACGYSSDSKEVAEGETVTLGDVHYTVIFSRYLNPKDSEDAGYLDGQPKPPEGSTYFGVFLEAQNDGDSNQKLPSSLTITDVDGNTYDVIPSESEYALPLGGEIEPDEQVPVLDTTPQQGPIEGSLALFLLDEEATNDRPLTLSIPGPEGPAEVTLDL
jgi:hypothetical protein